MDYVITSYPIMYRRFLVQDVDNEGEAWDKFNDLLPEPFDEESLGIDDGEADIELLTPVLRIQYGLEEVM